MQVRGEQLAAQVAKSLAPAYLVHGDEPLLALEAADLIRGAARAKVVDDPKQADAVLQFLQEARQKVILSLSGTGRVREYRLIYRVGFRVHDGKGAEYVQPTTIELSRDITFNDSDVLAKESEEQLLVRDMQTDMVQQIMRRLASAQPPKPVVQ